MPNPYVILGGLILWLASLGAVGYWQHGAGAAAQSVADQSQFDKVNADLTRQKAEANQALQTALQKNADTLAERDRIKTTLEQTRETNRSATNSLRTELAGVRLAFQSAGSGGGGGGSSGSGSGAAGNPTAAECVVPEAISRRLEAIVFDADTLRDDYRLLWDWAHSLK